MSSYWHYTPMTDTTDIPRRLIGFPRTDTRLIPVIDGELDETAELRFPWPRPAVTRYVTSRARWARRVARVRRSRFAADVRARWGTWLTVVGVLAVAWLLLRLVDLMHALAPIAGSWS